MNASATSAAPLAAATPVTTAAEALPLSAISALAFQPEHEAVERLLTHTAPLVALDGDILAKARPMVERIRAEGVGHGVEAFLHEYGLDTDEGIALMCLAEALLRIPDPDTANALIRGTLGDGDWKKHLGGSESLLVNASSWGLLLTGKMVSFGADPAEGVSGAITKLVGKLGEPVIREALKKAMRIIGGQFVLGETLAEALKESSGFAKKGYRFSYDILGEGARSDAQAMGYVKSYQGGIALIAPLAAGVELWHAPSISVKLSALHPRYQWAHKDRVFAELLPRLKDIILRAKAANITVSIDAEEATRLDVELELFAALLRDEAIRGWPGVGFVLQAYQKRAFHLVDWLAALARECGTRIPLRLVKGAYWDSEVKWAQMQGLEGYPVFTRKEYTDLSYLACADKILAQHAVFYPQFATHNARTVATIQSLAARYGVGESQFEFQRLHGMGEALHGQLLATHASRIYAPVGEHKDLLAYLIRRLLENGANTSFVHLLMDKERSVEELLADPIAQSRAHAATPNPATPLPVAIYGTHRANSRGRDLGNAAHVAALEAAMAPFTKAEWQAAPLLADGVASATQAPLRTLYSPANLDDAVGTVQDATGEQVHFAISRAVEAFPRWSAVPVAERAAMLERVADLIEARLPEILALCAREAGKTLADGIAEAREAADFCRYYAAEARRLLTTPEVLRGPTGESNVLSLHARGVFACISPWNFPLAIFIGQIAAALAAGNCVIAKPAEQTPLIATRAVAWLYEAGFPRDVVQLLPGDGETVGARLTKDPRIAGVVFTGGGDTALAIQQSLAQRGGPIIPFIAETGGQNCMVVDSSALLEQAVDDILLSAFGSAGQRCSALRVLFVQEDIADALLTLLAGALKELRLGHPLSLSTDIGPVIDTAAKRGLDAHVERMGREGTLLAEAVLPPSLYGHYVAPRVLEIRSIRQLEREQFGPILHVLRFKAGALEEVLDAIHSTGYGLTFGLHSRIEAHVRFFTERVHAGNIYVNRSMIGATVGVQPFGGEGLSGTGPKAGGPHYLLRFVSERTTTINTAAIGGNVTLLAG